jgi:4-amino-4-deoxy-L-arabinose transferase-like glycosyltransferase
MQDPTPLPAPLRPWQAAFDRAPRLYLAALGALLFLPFLGTVHLFDWDEINFAEAAREMLLTGDWLRVTIDFEPFWEKPPLFIWLQAGCMAVFGVGEFAARLPNALAGILTLPLLYHLAGQLVERDRGQQRRLGLLWVGAYAGSFLPHFYFRSGIIDPVFNLFIFLSVWHLHQAYQAGMSRQRFGQVALAGVWVGMAVLTKGPVGLLMTAATWGLVFLWRLRSPASSPLRMPFPGRSAPIALLAMLATTTIWYGVDLVRNGPWFLQQFFTYQVRLLTTQDAVLVGCFPASAFVLASLFPKRKEESVPLHPAPEGSGTSTRAAFRLWMWVLLLATLVIFSLVKTKIVHYSSLTYFPLAFLAAEAAERWWAARRTPRALLWLLGGLGGLWALLLVATPLVGMNARKLIPLVQEPFARGNLEASVVWGGWEPALGLLYAAAIGLALRALRRGDIGRASAWAFGGTAGIVCLILPILVPKVEGYSQRAAIAFYEGLQGKDVYVDVLAFKSYAHYFYSARQPRHSPSGVRVPADSFQMWLLFGPIDRPAYFATKVQEAARYRAMPQMQELRTENGFVFFVRQPPR